MLGSILNFFRPSRSSPVDTAPPWARHLDHKLSRILEREDQQMSAVNDLNNAVTALTSGFAALDTAVQTQLAAIAAANQNNDSAAISQAVANIQAVTSKMATDAAALTAAIPATTTVAAPPVAAPVVDTPPNVTAPSIDVPTVTDPNATPPSSDGSAG